MKKLLALLLIAATVPCWGVPQQINYQGFVTDSDGNPLNTNITMIFKLYADSTTTTALWTETLFSQTIEDGLFNVRLGEHIALPDSVLNRTQLWLGIRVGADAEMTPRVRIVSVGYAYRVGTVDGASLFPRHQAGLEGAGGKFIYQKLHEVPQEGFASMGGWLAKNEDTAYAWAYADVKARKWLFDPANKAQAYKIMRDLGYDIPPSFEAQYELELDQISPDGGFKSGEVMDKFVESLAITGDVPKGLDWRKYVDMKYVWAAQEALGLPKRPASL